MYAYDIAFNDHSISVHTFRSKIVENLAVVGYDTNNLHLAPYDWRLSYYNLEERDGYFSKLRTSIEGFVYVSFIYLFARSMQSRT